MQAMDLRSGARHIVIESAHAGDRFSVTVEDNGRGCQRQRHGLGLPIIRSILEMRGAIDVPNRPKGGASVENTRLSLTKLAHTCVLER